MGWVRITARVIVLVTGLLICCHNGLRAEPSAPLAAREILATGADVPRFGRIGLFGFSVLGIDDGGRVLLAGYLSTDRTGLFWADGRVITPLWMTGEPADHPVWLGTPGLSLSRSGAVAALGYSEDPAAGSWNYYTAVFAVAPGPLRRLAHVGESDSDGNVFCVFGDTRINDAGAVAFQAEVAPPGTSCGCIHQEDESERCAPTAIYLATGASLQRVAGAESLSPDGWHFGSVGLVGLAQDGTVIISTYGGDPYTPTPPLQVLSVKDRQVRKLVADGDVGPAGTPLTNLYAYAITANGSGDIAFSAQEGGVTNVYRTVQGAIIRVVRGNSPPRGDPFDRVIEPVFLNNRGDVSLTATWVETAANGYKFLVDGVLLYPAGGQGLVVAAPAGGGHLNNTGEIVVSRYTAGMPLEVLRWRDGSLERIVGTGDPAPGGGVFAAQGLEGPKCLADDGRVATTAYATDSHQGLLCGDAGGFQVVINQGDPAPEGGSFASFDQCGFSGEHELLFAGANASGTSVYRATPAGIERLIGPGDGTADGGQVQGLGFFPWFAFNSRGAVAAMASSAAGPALLRRRRDAPLEAFPVNTLPPVNGMQVGGVKQLGIAQDDTLVALVQLRPEYGYFDDSAGAIVLTGNGDARVLTTAIDPQLAGGPFTSLAGLFVRGDLIVFSAIGWPESRLFSYRLSEAAPRAVQLETEPPLVSIPWLWDVTARGWMSFDAYFREREGEPERLGRFLRDADGVQLLSEHTGFDADPVALNDRGNVLLSASQPPSGSARHSLRLAGPPAGQKCFVPPRGTPHALPTRTPTPTRTGAPTARATPTLCTAGCPVLQVSTTTGAPGEQVKIEVTLQTMGKAVVALENGIAFSRAAPIAMQADGDPDCQVNPAINKGASVFGFQPYGCSLSGDCDRIRALVLTLDRLAPIPDGSLLYTCTATIAGNAIPGRYSLIVTDALAADRAANEVALTRVDGAIVVVAPQPQGAAVAAPSSAPGTDGGCQLAATPSHGEWIVCFAALLLWRRCRGAAAPDRG